MHLHRDLILSQCIYDHMCNPNSAVHLKGGLSHSGVRSMVFEVNTQTSTPLSLCSFWNLAAEFHWHALPRQWPKSRAIPQLQSHFCSSQTITSGKKVYPHSSPLCGLPTSHSTCFQHLCPQKQHLSVAAPEELRGQQRDKPPSPGWLTRNLPKSKFSWEEVSCACIYWFSDMVNKLKTHIQQDIVRFKQLPP